MAEYATIRDLIHGTIGDYQDEIGNAAYDGIVDRMERVIASLLHRDDKSIYGDLTQYATRLDTIDDAILKGRIKFYTLAEYALLDELRAQVRGYLHDVKRLNGEIDGVGLWLARHQSEKSIFTPLSARVINGLEKRIDKVEAVVGDTAK